MEKERIVLCGEFLETKYRIVEMRRNCYHLRKTDGSMWHLTGHIANPDAVNGGFNVYSGIVKTIEIKNQLSIF